MYPFLKTITVLLVAAALNVQAVVMPGGCDCQGTAWTAALACARTTADVTPSCCANRNVSSGTTTVTPGVDPLPTRPACLCCPSRRAEGVSEKAPSLDRSELVVATLPVPESLTAAVRVTDRERLARVWQDDTHGIARQARLSVWLN